MNTSHINTPVYLLSIQQYRLQIANHPAWAWVHGVRPWGDVKNGRARQTRPCHYFCIFQCIINALLLSTQFLCERMFINDYSTGQVLSKPVNQIWDLPITCLRSGSNVCGIPGLLYVTPPEQSCQYPYTVGYLFMLFEWSSQGGKVYIIATHQQAALITITAHTSSP